MLRLLVFAHAPPWAAIALWLVLTVAIVLLARAIRREAQCEHRRRHHRLAQHERRLRAIETYLGLNRSPEDDHWP